MRKYSTIFFFAVFMGLLCGISPPVSADIPYVIYRLTSNNFYDCHPQINEQNHVIWESSQGILYCYNPRNPGVSTSLLEENELPYRKYTHPQILTLCGNQVFRAAAWIMCNSAGQQWGWFHNIRYWWEGHYEIIGNCSCLNFCLSNNANIAWESALSGEEGIWYSSRGVVSRLSESGCRPQISTCCLNNGLDTIYWLADEAWMTWGGIPVFEEIQYRHPPDITLRIKHPAGILDFHVSGRTPTSPGQVVFSGFDGLRFQIYRCSGIHPSDRMQITSALHDQVRPRINQIGMITWQGFDGHDWEIYRCLSPYDGIRQITNNDHDDLFPEINEQGNIVWCATDGRDWDVYLYSNITSQVYRISDTDGHAVFPKINNNNWVVCEYVSFYHNPWDEYDNTREILVLKSVL